jgi:hypothetical protein
MIQVQLPSRALVYDTGTEPLTGMILYYDTSFTGKSF